MRTVGPIRNRPRLGAAGGGALLGAIAAALVVGCGGSEPPAIEVERGREALLEPAGASIVSLPVLAGPPDNRAGIVAWTSARPPDPERPPWNKTFLTGTVFSSDPFEGAEANRFRFQHGALSWSARADGRGNIWLLWAEALETKGQRLAACRSEDGGRTWSAIEEVWRTEESSPLRLEEDSLVFGPGGEPFVLVRHRLGRGTVRSAFRVARREEERWREPVALPGTDDLSTTDDFGFAAAADGRLAVAFVTRAGRIEVVESADRGQTWRTIGGPGRTGLARLPLGLPGSGTIVRDGMPDLRAAEDDWVLLWERLVSKPRSGDRFESHRDVLCARRPRGAKGWSRAARANDRRTTLETDASLEAIGRPGGERMKELARENRAIGFRRPHLSIAPDGRLGASWIEMRDDGLAAVASFSDDGGRSWTPAIPVDPSGGGDVHAARGAFGTDASRYAVLLTRWPAEASVVTGPDLQVRAAELRVRSTGGSTR